MEEEEDMSPPFWLQNGGSNNHRRLRRTSSLFISSGTLVILLLVTALAFIFVVVPTLHSFTSHIFKPHSVKKSWDSLNLVLVLFAIFCGFLSRNNNTNDNETPRSSYEEDQTSFSDTKTPHEFSKPNIETLTPRSSSWYDYSDDRTPYNRLRSFRSYPDLRQESSWFAADERWRFYDDTHVNGYRELDLNFEEEEKQQQGVKKIEVNNRRVDNDNASSGAERFQGTEKRNKKASATKELFTSLKEKKKKKKKKKQSILNSELPSTMPSSSHPPPPPPPPPPPSLVFHNVFYSKKNKHKKHNSVSSSNTKLVSKTEPVRGRVGTIKQQPHVSNKGDDFFSLDENVITGNESPLITIPPPPPPPPPFKMPAWKFRVQGDYVRIDSISSSSSGLPDIDEVEESPMDGGEPAILLVYPNPSPDVDTKADNFIENFRAGLRRRN